MKRRIFPKNDLIELILVNNFELKFFFKNGIDLLKISLAILD